MRRIAVLLSALLALFAFAPGAQAEPYSPGLPTSCEISVTTSGPGKRVVIDVSVTANGAEQPTGTVDVSISKGNATARGARAAAPVWTATERYEGAPLRIVGPRLGAGDYLAGLAFSPEGNLYASCNDTTRFRVAAGEVGGRDSGGGPGGSGFLPNTGGPHLILLLLGLGMVAVGGGTVVRSRQFA